MVILVPARDAARDTLRARRLRGAASVDTLKAAANRNYGLYRIAVAARRRTSPWRRNCFSWWETESLPRDYQPRRAWVKTREC
ncbi:hypothetical protein SCH01S_17_00080 [Sphingomonas changbaiensis NBRC 104936]|uniref:Uncharacterized protein n=1 Tax=Sphingomonas changbaiensis NBRC 104936 TaxID=1219043 RepID=A0A0E9MM91_9SPHN|nr:hypothetical protein SCH01S_17_00080 [Sphingomonas changbaiensis NBRC 104936]